MKVGVLNYGGGNLQSVHNALEALGYEPLLVHNEGDVDRVTHIILPGQGEFGDVMRQLHDKGLVTRLKKWISEDRPYFGICVGFQILFEGSDEAPGVDGLGIIKGRCIKFGEAQQKKIPQMGWNQVSPPMERNCFWKGLGDEPYFYFVHSYYPTVSDTAWSIAKCVYGHESFAAAVEKGNVLGCQFHPEKSQEAGLLILQNFLEKG